MPKKKTKKKLNYFEYCPTCNKVYELHPPLANVHVPKCEIHTGKYKINGDEYIKWVLNEKQNIGTTKKRYKNDNG